eukprot:CAMPEP_0170479598 /NCGR_PEP_ID=MMETSP0208-20121228/773_1 /TAXON_ID=197538 /ORGANISM="Strombidium inclinatum, Strain S3" /LENGTH=37 /DNA_ID= /DNA_START= /DNA_END= /DNA_ORIENTATION=
MRLAVDGDDAFDYEESRSLKFRREDLLKMILEEASSL